MHFRALPWLLLPLVAACSSVGPSKVADLAENKDLYRDVGWRSKLPGDRAVCVLPVADARRPDLLQAADSGGFPVLYDGDGAWQRPVPVMVDDVLRRELASSGIFAGLTDAAGPNTLLLEPSLVHFTTGALESAEGGRSLGEVGLRLRVHGIAEPDGTRPILLDQVYGERQVSGLSMMPPSPYLLVGRALRVTMQRALSGLDGSNVSRSAAPAAAADVPATVPR